MEFSVPADDGNTAYTYAIARIGFADEGIADEVEVFNLLCSKASEKFAARKEEQVCIFDDYARLRAGALDAVAWYEYARMPRSKRQNGSGKASLTPWHLTNRHRPSPESILARHCTLAYPVRLN